LTHPTDQLAEAFKIMWCIFFSQGLLDSNYSTCFWLSESLNESSYYFIVPLLESG
jgi:hypothetical protein